MENRPPIPAELKRKVLVEAGHRCAIPTCRHIEVDIHHIVPWAKVQRHDYDNLIALCPNCHSRADRGAIDRKSLKLYKARLRFEHERFSNTEIDILFLLSKVPIDHGLHWPAGAELLLLRIADAGFIQFERAGGGTTVRIVGIETTPWLIFLTSKGREFIDSFDDPFEE